MHCAECTSQFCQVQCKQPAGADCPMNDRALFEQVQAEYHKPDVHTFYEASVESMRCLLYTSHGNFGSVDGDGAAAMRYTEAKMSKICAEMLADLDKETVDMVPNYDERLMQPSVLPARFPNLLVNGSGGIAVGMATNIPPHNLSEDVGRCGRDHKQIGTLSQRDMFNLPRCLLYTSLIGAIRPHDISIDIQRAAGHGFDIQLHQNVLLESISSVTGPSLSLIHILI